MAISSDPNPDELRIPNEEGVVPDSRIKNAYQAWRICKDTEDADVKRAKKRSRIFRAYMRFPPSDYSTLFEAREGGSNVGFGMMAYVVDNNHSSFYDMLTERVLAAEFRTKYGEPNERAVYSEALSEGFDMVLREWDDFLTNAEQHLLDMLLYSKGIEMWPDKEGCCTEHVSANDFLVPDGTRISGKNFDYCVVKKKYQLHEIWEMLEEAGEAAGQRGWNRQNVLSAMRHQREEWNKEYETNEEYVHAIARGDVTLASNLKEYLDCYILFIREFKKKTISKFVVLKDYGPSFSLTRGKSRKKPKEEEKDTINKEGFMFVDTEYAECHDDVFVTFMDSAGIDMWHAQPSLAEKIFVQCRQYDFSMNAIMDAIRVNMSIMVQAANSDATEKIKQLVFGPLTIIPSDVPFVQQRIQTDTTSATQTLQFMMLDMFRGIGEYRINERAGGGEAVTATQNQNDTAESAKLSGTQLKRYNGQHSKYYRKFYAKMIALKKGERDYEIKEKFLKFLDERKVPHAAAEMKNIEYIKSNMLAGAGSPSYKLMAAEKTINLTNVAPKDKGQANAVQDALAALHGRDNVSRYFTVIEPDPTWNDQKAGWENEMLSNPLANPADVRVMPEDNHVRHTANHLADMERVIALVTENLKSGKITDSVAETAAFRLLNIGGHVMGHLDILSRDETKEQMVQLAHKKLQEIQQAAGQMANDMKAVKEQREKSFDPASDPDIAKKMALSQIEVDTANQLKDIKLNNTASKAAQQEQIKQEQHSNKLAMDRVATAEKIKTDNALAVSKKRTKSTPAK